VEGAPDADRCSHAILLVEDDPVTRTLAETALRAQGYEVITAADGQDAIVESRALGRPIDLLITDVLLPGISGSDVAERLLREQPNLRVLFISGHADEALVRHGVHERAMPFLPKPFTPGELADRVRATLQERL
jgi:DNA-binding response OmpR family regulator